MTNSLAWALEGTPTKTSKKLATANWRIVGLNPRAFRFLVQTRRLGRKNHSSCPRWWVGGLTSILPVAVSLQGDSLHADSVIIGYRPVGLLGSNEIPI